MRSFLFVPADSERKLVRSESTPVDAVVYDLEDSVLPERKAAARRMLGAHLDGRAASRRSWIRVNALDSGEFLPDLVASVPLRPAGIVLPKIRGPEDVLIVSHYLTMAEAFCAVPAGSIEIIAVCTETPMAVLNAGELARAHLPRLSGLMWGAEDLSSALGAADPRGPDGAWRPLYAHVRNQVLLTAHALGVMAIDTVFVDVRDLDGCRRSAIEARGDGFTGKIAIHPDQVAVINDAFTPSLAEMAAADRVVSAFATGAGAVVLDGKMLDIPHLMAARRLLAAVQPDRPV
jgi:citrate lyase subunit beta/citryl-CoA lyase